LVAGDAGVADADVAENSGELDMADFLVFPADVDAAVGAWLLAVAPS
jgi:hypothetical protein